ncbi:cation transporter [Frateuria hangzhouensis]|uniref:cation transporter n=1 Tax=Frateuria hangzhouensis TaxID=2995589 RepID=UPI00226093D1|nr:cation transporter [Frateuria sp. STR12]MCX7515233.1 cation transporter [Frateuria sp. STR12]
MLWVVLAINVAIFLAEFGAGFWADSTALQGDSLDSLGDALVYGLSLMVLGRSLRARAGAALIKGGIQLVFAGAVLAEVVRKVIVGAEPLPGVMAVAASLALIANVTCLALLTRFRADDINMRSVWLCSRNDVIGNAGVLLTTALIAWTGWRWLDLIFGAGLALLFLRTAVEVLSTAWPQFSSRRSPNVGD